MKRNPSYGDLFPNVWLEITYFRGWFLSCARLLCRKLIAAHAAHTAWSITPITMIISIISPTSSLV
jgi:hypothetical protein